MAKAFKTALHWAEFDYKYRHHNREDFIREIVRIRKEYDECNI